MSVETISLCACPYCEEDSGEVLLNVPSFLSAGYRPEGIAEAPDDQSELDFLIFNSNRPEPGPCNHLVFFSGNVASNEETGSQPVEYSLEFDWWLPVSHQLDLDSKSVLLQPDIGDNMRRFHRRIPFWAEWFQKGWVERKAMPARCYLIAGKGFFCRDAAVFVNDLVTNRDRYNEWWNGDDSLGTGLFVEGFTAEQLGGPPR